MARPAAPSPFRLGDPVKPDILRNCQTCARVGVCRDPKKSFKYRCSRWQELPQLDGGGGLIDLLGKPMTSAPVDKSKKIIKPTKAEVRKLSRRQSQIETDDENDSEESKHISMMDMVERSLLSESPIPPDFLIQDGDLPEANNFWQWQTSKKFAGEESSKLFPKQFQVLMHLEGCYCPRCSDPKYVDDIPYDMDIDNILDHIVLLRKGKCPKCKATKSELVASGEIQENYLLLAIIGQRSGKTVSAMEYERYSAHRWLKSQNPQRLMNVKAQNVLTSTYVALTFEQAKKNMFSLLSAGIKDSPWFNQLHSLLDDAAERLGVDPLYKIGDTIIRYNHRRLLMEVASSNKRTLRGNTRMSSIMDEADWFPFGKANEGKERATGEEVYTALSNSMATLIAAHETLLRKGYNNIPKPYVSLISSPQDVNALVMAMQRATKGSQSVYSCRFPTWEFNPTIKRNSSIITNAYRVDAVKAERDFGANPPLSAAGWMIGAENVMPLFNKNGENAVYTKQSKIKSKKTGAVRTTAVAQNFTKEFTGGRVMTIDAAVSGNHFAFAVASKDFEESVTYIDALGEIVMAASAPLSFEKVFTDLLLPVCETLGVQYVIADQWQSESTLDRFRQAHEIEAKKYSLKYVDFEDAKKDFLDRKIAFPDLESGMDTEEDIFNQTMAYPTRFIGRPVAHLFYQILTVRDIVGKTVTKGNGTEDDLFRSVILAHWALNQEEIVESLGEVQEDAPVNGTLGLVMSGGGTGSRETEFGVVTSFVKAGHMASSGTRTISVSNPGGSTKDVGLMVSNK